MTETTHTAHVRENGEGSYAVDISIGAHALKGDEPIAAGGNDTGPSPYDFLSTALATCTVMTMRWYAKRNNWPLEKVEATITHEKREGRDHFTKSLKIEGNELTEEQRTKLLEVAAKCPVHRTLQSDITIETNWA